ncbi:gamma-irradiation and mitomycin c induced 1 [Striga asiatica]|uniref:Gamma-irradiation and mitomycin c induced 1 n=1 Tax=Striga asiatica TaxID=4170 RepID=A0A5A7PPP9_STRAF|nr:gamma-irradiation and mitomycin c induced 1 [Striga asiatica]
MYSNTPHKAASKRPLEDSSSERPRKSPFGHVKVEDGLFNKTKIYKFRILMPNATTLELKISEQRNEMPIKQFLDAVKRKYFNVVNQRSSEQLKGEINWKYPDLHIMGVDAKKLSVKIDLHNLPPNQWHILCLHDGSAKPDAYEGMWDLTPDTDLLKELPDDYTFETALADLIDNSLQALWSNGRGDDKFISVEWHTEKISIFDSGPGMDGTDGNLVKWGKMGASLHRSVRGQAVGGKPPYLKPFFGMFGYGGPVATMCLGRRAVVSSKTKNCNKVFTLHLEREALVNASSSEKCWKTKGGMRDPSEDEKKNSPHGSFTKVEIFEPKMKTQDVKHLQCKLKDIYFPYIQCDEMSGKTSRPVVFQVNGEDLAEIWEGEVATTNRHSCNGPNFVLQLHFSISQDPSLVHGQSQRVLLEANARLTCVYFPIVEGEESIDKIIGELNSAGCGIRESFESFSRVSVRRLGRLLPDTRWALLPFMVPKPKKGEKGQMFKRCCSRVKCFIDMVIGCRDRFRLQPNSAQEVQIEISRGGKKLTLSQLEKQYTDWVLEMHDRYDEEVDGGLDEPTLVILPSKIKKLELSSTVVRVHEKIKRRGKDWTAGQKIKVIKGACTGFHSNNGFVTLEYIILEGLPGDTCGEGRLICRPLGLQEDKGCHLVLENGSQTIDIRDSVVIPIRAIDSEKDLPSVIEAGYAPPENVVAVIRPKAYDSGNCPNSLDQKFIVKDKHEMSLEVKFNAGVKWEMLFEKAGFYTFSFAVNGLKDVRFEQVVQVQASAEIGYWKVVSHYLDEPYTIRVGFCAEPLKVMCCDRNEKCVVFTSVPKLTAKLSSNSTVIAHIRSMEVVLATDKSIMEIKDVVAKSTMLDDIRPGYKATLDICTIDKDFSLSFPCQVLPGTPKTINVHPRQLKRELLPDQIIETLMLEVFDEYGNHAKEGDIILLSVDGFSFQEGSTDIHSDGKHLKKVNADGYVDLSNILKVSRGYGKDVSLAVISEEKTILQLNFHTEIRKLQSVPKVFKNCEAGSTLKNIVFEVIDSKGNIDESIHDEVKHGRSHTLTLKSNSLDIDDFVSYSFRCGQCTIRSVPLPQRGGIFSFSAAHSRYSELNFTIEVHVKEVVEENRELTLNYEDVVVNPAQSPRDSCKHLQIPQTSSFFMDLPDGHTDSCGNLRIPPTSHFLKDLRIPPTSPLLKDIRAEHKVCSPPVANEYFALPIGCLPQKDPKLEDTRVQNKELDVMPVQDMASQEMGNLEEIENDMTNWGLIVMEHERKLERLNTTKSIIQQQILDLQDYYPDNVSSMCSQDWIREQIKSNTQSVASVFCKLLEEPLESRPSGILGIVALLGTTESIDLSRALAKYLGDDLMLAIVCENYVEAFNLDSNTVHELANKVGQSIIGGYQALCLEDISGPQNLLSMQLPKLPTGDVPQGFLGYAVNMITVETSYLQWRSKSGRGLRETLFYRLFGELQVYKDRDCMMKARSCIKDGAVSMDGSIIKGNGLVSLGNWDPVIIFPVENRAATPLQSSKKLRLLQTLDLELMETNEEIEKLTQSYLKDQEMLGKSVDSRLSPTSSFTSPPSLSPQSLLSLPFASTVPSLSPVSHLVVTSGQPEQISINNVEVSDTPIFDDGFVFIYAIDGFFNLNFTLAYAATRTLDPIPSA